MGLRRNFLGALKSVSQHKRYIQLSSKFIQSKYSNSYICRISNNIKPPNTIKISVRCLSANKSSDNVPSDTVTIQRWKQISRAIIPYGQLMRIDRPVGSLLLFWPCGWSIALSATAGTWPDPVMLGLFATGAFIMRSAGCTINDMWDKDIDNKVERTKNRPLACGDISQLDALVFLSAQLGIGLLVLLQLNLYSIVLGASSIGMCYLIWICDAIMTQCVHRVSYNLSSYETYNVLATIRIRNGL